MFERGLDGALCDFVESHAADARAVANVVRLRFGLLSLLFLLTRVFAELVGEMGGDGFAFPGMTTYSVSKSFSMSTPRLLLGRSFTWPKEASTVNPLPRYFWIVFALAGDSTMTRPFDNGSSNDSLFASKLT